MIVFAKKTYQQALACCLSNIQQTKVCWYVIFIFCLIFFQKNTFAQQIFFEKNIQNPAYFQDKTLTNSIWQNQNANVFLQKMTFNQLFQKYENTTANKLETNLYIFEERFEDKIAEIQRISATENQHFLAIFYENILKNTLSNDNWAVYLQNQAFSYQKNQQYAQAIFYWENLRKLVKNSVQKKEIDFYILQNHLALNDYEKIYNHFEKADFSNLEKGNYAYFFGKKDTANVTKHWKKAEDFFVEFLKNNKNQDKNTKETLAKICEIYYAHCDFGKIIPLTNDFLKNAFFTNNSTYEKLEPLDFQILKYTSEALFQEKDYEKAVLHYETWKKLAESDFILKFPNNPALFTNDALFHYGWALYQTEKWGESSVILEKFGFLQEKQSDIAFFYAGQSYMKTGVQNSAKDAFAQANRLTKNAEMKQQTHILLAKIATNTKDFKSASQYWQTYKELYPQDAQAENADYFIQKNQLQALGFKNFHKNLDSLTKNNAKENAQFYIQLALEKSLEKTENPQEKQENEQIIADLLQNKNLSLHQQRNLKYTLAERYLQNQNPQLAIPLYQELLDWKAKDDDFSMLSHYGLGYGYYQTQQFMLANTHFQLCIVGNSPYFSLAQKNDAFVRLADGYFGLNDFSKAKKYYEYALKAGEKIMDKTTKEYVERQIKELGIRN